jgi:hypothetical protein
MRHRPDRLPCDNATCDYSRLCQDYSTRAQLASSWNRPNACRKQLLVTFERRAATSLLQYDEHRRQLWFSHRQRLYYTNLDTGNFIEVFQSEDDDILCYKVYNERMICLASGDRLIVIDQQTNEQHKLPEYNDPLYPPRGMADIYTLDVFSNDQVNHVIISGSRYQIVSGKRRVSTVIQHQYSLLAYLYNQEHNESQVLWRTRVTDRVLATRFTTDGHYFLAGTSGIRKNRPILLFNTERPEPVHVSEDNVRPV